MYTMYRLNIMCCLHTLYCLYRLYTMNGLCTTVLYVHATNSPCIQPCSSIHCVSRSTIGTHARCRQTDTEHEFAQTKAHSTRSSALTTIMESVTGRRGRQRDPPSGGALFKKGLEDGALGPVLLGERVECPEERGEARQEIVGDAGRTWQQ